MKFTFLLGFEYIINLSNFINNLHLEFEEKY